jgi:DNA-binding transcriptional ArsR family regulator
MARQLELDAEALKVLAHPLRMRMVTRLRSGGPASVTSLADEFDLTTGAVSYHLRLLARHGVVHETEPPADAPRGGLGRKQRFWQMAVDELHVTGFDFLTDEQTHSAADLLLRQSLADRSARLAEWFGTATSWPPSWQQASSSGESFLRLDARRTRALADEIQALIAKYRDEAPSRGSRTIEVQYAVFPSAKAPSDRTPG